jgi:hypothetical protein
MSDTDSRIGLVVDSETKDEWNQYVEETPEVSSLSQLIRTAVYAHINSQTPTVEEDNGGGLNSSQARKLNNIADTVTQIEETVNDVDGRLADVRRYVSIQSELSDIENEVYRRLPTTDPSTEEWQSSDWREVDTQYTKSQIAEALDISENKAYKVLQHLYETLGHVRLGRASVDGETVYWREG